MELFFTLDTQGARDQRVIGACIMLFAEICSVLIGWYVTIAKPRKKLGSRIHAIGQNGFIQEAIGCAQTIQLGFQPITEQQQSILLAENISIVVRNLVLLLVPKSTLGTSPAQRPLR